MIAVVLVAVMVIFPVPSIAQTPREIMPRSPNYFGGDTSPRGPDGRRLEPSREIEDALLPIAPEATFAPVSLWFTGILTGHPFGRSAHRSAGGPRRCRPESPSACRPPDRQGPRF